MPSRLNRFSCVLCLWGGTLGSRVAFAAAPPAPSSAGAATAPASSVVQSPMKAKKPKGSACKADRERLCAGVSGRDARRACLVEHRDALSATCRKVIDKAEAERRDCSADSERLCSEVKPGYGRVMACLIGRKADVSVACRAHVDASIARYKASRAKKSKGTP